MHEPALSESEIFALDRPEPSLLYYYAAGSIFLGPFFFFALIPSTFATVLCATGSTTKVCR